MTCLAFELEPGDPVVVLLDDGAERIGVASSKPYSLPECPVRISVRHPGADESISWDISRVRLRPSPSAEEGA